MNRRNLLKGLFASSIAIYPIHKLIKEIIKQDKFEPLGIPTKGTTRNYIQFNFYGGPSRWCYDHFLNPYGDHYIHNPMTSNKIDPKKGPGDQELKTFNYKGVNTPELWAEDLVSNRKMRNLLDNSLTIRGVHMEGTSGHPMSSSKTIAPSIGGISIDGILADLSTKPISSITIGDTPVNRAFKSRYSSSIKINGDTPNRLEYLLSPFYLQDSTDTNGKEMDILLDKAIEMLNNSPESKVLNSDLKRARLFFRDNITEYLKEYDSLINKYSLIIKSALNHQIKGVDDSPIPTPKLPITVDGDREIQEILGAYHINGTYHLNDDLRDILKSVEVSRLSEDFALAEFLSKYGLSSSIVFSDKNEIGVMFDKVISNQCYRESDIFKNYNKKTNKTTISSMRNRRIEYPQLSFDSHMTGSIINTLTSTKYFYIFSSCLDELIDSTKKIKIGKSTLFDETIIHVTSEFDRSPREDLSGSDHNEQAHVSTFYSGIIDGPIVLGNIYTGENALGTIGNSAPIKELKSKIGISHVSSTLSTLLRIPPIIKRSQSLVEIKNNKVKPTIKLAENIRGSSENYNS